MKNQQTHQLFIQFINHVYIIKLNELAYLLVFHAYINEMHGSRSKIPSKKYRQTALREGI
jgi:hypothetical protein